MEFECEGHGFKFSHRRSIFPLGRPLLASVPFLKSDVMSFIKELKDKKNRSTKIKAEIQHFQLSISRFVKPIDFVR